MFDGRLVNDLITVVIPTHQRPATLYQTLISVCRQRAVDFEVVVVDDTGGDVTRAMLDALAPECVQLVVNHSGGGAAGSRNLGVEHAAGSWIAFCDDDDIWAPDKLRRQLDEIHRQGADWSCTGAVTVGPDLAPIGHERLGPEEDRTLLEWNIIPGGGSSVLARADVIREAGGFDADLSNMEDWDMWIRLDEFGPVASVDLPLVGYRLWPSSKSANVDGMRKSARRILERHDRWPPSERLAYELEWYVMWKMTNAGDRHAATVAARLATRHRSARCALRAGVLLASPALARTIDRRRRALAVPEEWRQFVGTWLPELRAQLVST